MIDYRHVTFASSEICGITLMQHQHVGLNIVASVQGGHAIVSLSPETLFEVTFFNLNESHGSRFFIPDCELRLDPSRVADARRDPPLGSLIIAEAGISLMVKPPRSAPSPLRLIGDAIKNSYEGVAITSWLLQSSAQYAKPGVLYAFEHTESEPV